ncbi:MULTISPECIES: YicC/YloC family endoribonuclease [unclassified Clostridium]|uniref:YicC/YloC family endoribonuclease n=1 Tax=unclassified Clostridium TaxID=2614128 RepID=UPI000E9CADA3|nr:YicC family protein [Clostridium sp.]
MIKSMTGFGRGTSESEASSFIVEIKTVNHRYFELNARMPRTLISLEDGIRKYVNDKIKRGKVDIFITQNQGANEDMSVVVNESLAENYVEALHNLRDKYDLRDDISATTLARFPEVLKLEQKEEDLEKTWKILLPAVEEAVHNLVSMRQQEGEKLLIDITKRCECISSNVDIINRRVPEVTEEYRARLLKKVEEILAEKSIDENRIAMEVVLQADKSCVDEEIVRLKSHVAQVIKTFKLGEPIGRKLDFIVQEMNREANTIASKVNDLELTNIALDIKSDIEKIREQVQNIE